MTSEPDSPRSYLTVFDLLGLVAGVVSAVMIVRDTVGSGNWIVRGVNLVGAVVMIPVAWLVVRLLFQVLIFLVLALAPVGRKPDPGVTLADPLDSGTTNLNQEPRPGRDAPTPPISPDEAESR